METFEQIYEKKIDELYAIAPSFQNIGRAGFHPGLERMEDFVGSMGNPQLKFKTIHIAGTNGKGSVAHLLATSLSASFPGKKIGLYTSPHLLDFRERIKIVRLDMDHSEELPSFEMIGRRDVLSFLERYDEYISGHRPSFFEITTSMAFDFFAEKGVDIAVIECGLGGRLDSTNVIDPILSIITSIGMDHSDILGETIEKVAFEKGGIIKRGRAVVVGGLQPEALSVVRSIASEKGASFYTSSSEVVDKALLEEMDLKSEAQEFNLKTLYTALKVLSGELGCRLEVQREVLVHTAAVSGLRGRWEHLSEDPVVICDIGHNRQALSISMRQLAKEASGRELYMIIGMAADKDIRGVSGLFPSEGHYIYTQAKGSRALSSPELMRIVDMVVKEGLEESRYLDSVSTSSVEEAVAIAKNRMKEEYPEKKKLLFIGGSSYVVAEALELFE